MSREVRIEWIVMLAGLACLLPWPFVTQIVGYLPWWYRGVLIADLIAMGVIAARRFKRMRDVWR